MKLIVFFVLLWTAAPGRRAPPQVKVFERDTKVESNILLTCLATGFSSQDIIMWIKRDGRKLYKEDGLQSSGVRLNGDDTFQRRDSVEILSWDWSKYTCEVIHEASSMNVTMWRGHRGISFLRSSEYIIGGAVGGLMVLVLVLVAVVLGVLYKKGIIGAGRKGSQGSLKSNSTLGSSFSYDINFLTNDNINGVPLTTTGENISDRATNATNCGPDVNLLLQNVNEHR